jgi:hypothetical protein
MSLGITCGIWDDDGASVELDNVFCSLPCVVAKNMRSLFSLQLTALNEVLGVEHKIS